MNSPLLTVVLPVHNGLPYLEEALQSILTQTFSNLLVLAIDDGSTDGSSQYLDSVSDLRLKVIHQPQSGLGAVLNLAIDRCETPYLARMDADDISLPERLQLQMEKLCSDSRLVAIGSPLNFLVDKNIQKGLSYPTQHDAIVRDLLRGEFSLSHPTLVMKTDAAHRTRYRIAGAGEDLDFCLRLAECGQITNLTHPQYLYRLHENSVSMTRFHELERGYAYARKTGVQRRDGLPETPMSSFFAEWESRGVMSRLLTRLRSVSSNQYRRARITWARGLYLRGMTHSAASLLLQPLKAVRVLARKAGGKTSHPKT